MIKRLATAGLWPPLYFCWAILLGSIVACVTPPWQNPDEGAHAERAIQISLGHWVGYRIGPRIAGGLTDPGVNQSAYFTAALPFHGQAKASAAMLAAAEAVKPGRPELAAFDNTATYPPFLYAAAALGAAIGRLGHMHVVATLHLMRMLNAVLASAIGAAAIAAARRTRFAVAATLLLPMSVALGASPSQDALLIPLAAWAVACIDGARNDPARAPGLAKAAVIAIALLLVSLARPPYVSLALLLLALPAISWRIRIGLLAAVVALTLAWTGYVAARISVPMNAADPAGQVNFILHHPSAFPASVANTVTLWGSDYVAQAVGVLGWLDTPLPGHFLRAVKRGFPLLLLSAAVADAVPRGAWWRSRLTLGMLACAVGAVGVFLSLYVIWTPPGATAVYGIQGRYFLPLLPALALAMPNLGRLGAVFRPAAWVAVLLLGAIGPVVTVTTLIDRYYLQP